MGWKRTAKIYVFSETQSKYGNKYWKLCIKMNLTKDDSTSRSWLSKYFSQIKVIAVFTLTLSHLRSIPLFIVVTTCEGKCGSRVRVKSYPHPVSSWFYVKQFIISGLSIRFYLILSYTIDVNALYNRCLSLVILLISPNVF